LVFVLPQHVLVFLPFCVSRGSDLACLNENVVSWRVAQSVLRLSGGVKLHIRKAAREKNMIYILRLKEESRGLQLMIREGREGRTED